MPVMSDILDFVNPMSVMTQDHLKPAAEKDMKKFAEANPDAARDLKTLKTAGLISCLGGVGSVGAGMAFFASRPGTLNGRLFNMALGGVGWGIVGFLVSTNVASLTTGTYKINPIRTNKEFAEWWKANGGATS